MAQRIKGITVEIGGDTQPLNKALKDVSKTAASLNSELRIIDKLLKLDPTNTTLLAQKQEVLAKSIENTTKKLNALKSAQEQAKAQLERGEIGADQYRVLERQVISTENSLNRLQNEAQQTDEALNDAGDAAQKAGKDMNSLSVGGVALGTVLGNVATKLLEFAGSAVTFLTDAVEETKEFRSDLSKLEQNAKAAGTGIDDVTDDLEYFVAITDETDSSVEALSNLLKAGFTGETLTDAVNNLSGAVVAFPDTLKIESLADSLQETLATGEATGQYGELLERLGVNLEDFNKGLQKCTTSAEKQQYAVDILAKNGMADLNAQYKEANADLIAYSTAQTRYTETLSKVGAAMQPVMTALTDTKTLLLEGMIPALETTGQALSEKLASPSVQNSFKKLGEGLAEVASAFANFAVFIIENGEMIIKIIGSIAAGFVAWKISSIIQSMGGLKAAFQAIIPAIKNMGKAITAVSSSTIIGALVTVASIIATIAESFLGASEATEDFKSEAQSLSETAQNLITDYNATSAALAVNADNARTLATEIQDLDTKIKSGTLSSSELAMAQAELETKTVQYNTAVGEEVLQIDAATGAIDGSTAALADNTEALIENAKKAAEMETLKKAYQAQSDAVAQMYDGLARLNELYPELNEEQQGYIDELKEMEPGTEEFNKTLIELWKSTGRGTDGVEALSNTVSSGGGIFKQANNEAAGLTEGIMNAAVAFDTAKKSNEFFSDAMLKNAEAATEDKNAIDETAEAVAKLGDEDAKRLIWMEESGEKMSELEQQQLDALKASEDGRYQTLSEAVQKEKELYDERVKNLSYAFQNIKDEMNEASITSIEDITSNLNAYSDAMNNWYTNQQVLAENGLGAFIQVFEDMGPAGYAQAQYIVDQIKNGAEDQLPALKDALAKVIGVSEYELTNWDSAMLFSGGSGAVQDVADGEASNSAAQNEAKNQIEDTVGSMRDIITDDGNFYYLGIGIINRLASGMRDMAWKLYDVADNVVNTLKSKFNFEISVSSTGRGAKFQGFATGGIISREQIVRVAERGPEAIIPLDRLGGIIQGVLDNNGGGSGGNTYQLNVYTSDLSDGAQVRLFKNFRKWAGRRLN